MRKQMGFPGAVPKMAQHDRNDVGAFFAKLASTFAVAHVDLVASAPSPQGHVYTTLARATLGSPA